MAHAGAIKDCRGVPPSREQHMLVRLPLSGGRDAGSVQWCLDGGRRAACSGVGRGTACSGRLEWSGGVGIGESGFLWGHASAGKFYLPLALSAENESLVAPSVPQTGRSNTVSASLAWCCTCTAVGMEHRVPGSPEKSPPECR